MTGLKSLLPSDVDLKALSYLLYIAATHSTNCTMASYAALALAQSVNALSKLFKTLILICFLFYGDAGLIFI